MMSDSPNQDTNPITEGPAPANFPGGGPVPEGAESAKPYPGGMMMIEPPKVKGWPYVRRSFKLLANHKLIVTATLLLTLAMNLAPFVVAAAFGPIVQMLGGAARASSLGNVCSLTGSSFGYAEPGATGIRHWLATPLIFTTVLII